MVRFGLGLLTVALVCLVSSKLSLAADTKDKTIVEVAAAADSFKTLVTAVKAAGLVETLSGEGPFTVLADRRGLQESAEGSTGRPAEAREQG